MSTLVLKLPRVTWTKRHHAYGKAGDAAIAFTVFLAVLIIGRQ